MLMQSQVDVTILPCPVYGRTPSVSLKGIAGHGCWATLKCKPFLGRAHLQVTEGKAHPERALRCVVDTWNKAVMEDEEYDD